MEIYKILVMSTGHLKKETFESLNGGAWPISFVNEDVYGTIIRVPYEDFEDEDYTKDLVDCMLFAEMNDCDYIRFDGDANVYSDLPTYDWK